WSSPVARQAHNLKAAGSNPAPATKSSDKTIRKKPASCGLFAFQKRAISLAEKLRFPWRW
ncbi:hypothetical protein, partial [Rhizobium ruizarguesonis]|uniref:hypothetical protein n=1 Tax=Rhizobium ruizarguesonis TaxID=2081791 RepID=UPI001A8FC47D